jgi:hypothetical protein
MPQRTNHQVQTEQHMKCLDQQLLGKIDAALCEVDQFGEVRLIVVKGKLRFIQILRSESLYRTQIEVGDE